ncbi:hypothetical protein AX774_g6125 [Zancudomyces culisetae]|uniref:Uncharacterized protein n=1 Tax=Zancudomyces culisetae TaxID=1213189 RepID=A0A1R1PHH3_ZANCU|nr:hypothetical protein AX774_g6125 [Zancudomyces culisetae]|eukprot:OMH80426.1 hypothetical protein AX774_g6125 [Zancudomyces culisetae]
MYFRRYPGSRRNHQNHEYYCAYEMGPYIQKFVVSFCALFFTFVNEDKSSIPARSVLCDLFALLWIFFRPPVIFCGRLFELLTRFLGEKNAFSPFWIVSQPVPFVMM